MGKFTFSFLLAIGLVLGLRSQTANTDSQIQPVDCSQMYSQGCQSLNDMIAAKDKGLLQTVHGKRAIACFRSFEDRFFIVAFNVPDFDVSTGERKKFDQVSGTVVFASFEKGISQDRRYSFGSWTKPKDLSAEEAWFASSEESDLQAFIGPSEISLQYKYPNISNTTTTYTAKIRQSTLRLSEIYEWPQGNLRSKTGPATRSKPTFQEQYSGNCAELRD